MHAGGGFVASVHVRTRLGGDRIFTTFVRRY